LTLQHAPSSFTRFQSVATQTILAKVLVNQLCLLAQINRNFYCTSTLHYWLSGCKLGLNYSHLDYISRY